MNEELSRWTLRVRLNNEPEGEVLALQERGRAVLRAAVEDDGALVFSIRTYERETPLRLTVPPQRRPRELEIVWLPCRAELWADGALADEEWPLGGCFRSREITLTHPAGIEAELSFSACVRERTPAPIAKSAQYWAPEPGISNVGDCMPFSDGGRFHVYYLKDRRGHRSKWGKGAHQFAHISTRDLVHWENHPEAVEITHPWEGSICTGSVIKAGELYYAFYAVRMMDETSARLSWATSADGVRFEKSERYFSLSAPYETTSARDPEVFRDEQGLYHMLVTTNLAQSDTPARSGCLAHLTSPDLTHWEQRDPFLVPGYTDQPECSDYFAWNGWYYLVFSNYGAAKYRLSRSPFGPWLRPRNDLIDGLLYRVPKTAAFGENRRLAAGFLCNHPEGTDYAGCLVLRELLQHLDGTLGTGFVPELLPPLSGETRTAELAASPDSCYRSSPIAALRNRSRMTVEITPAAVRDCYGLTLSAPDCPAVELRAEPLEGRIGVYPLHGSPFDLSSKRVLHGIEGLGDSLRLELILNDGILDLCINGSRTLVSRLSGWQLAAGCEAGCFVKDGGASFTATV